MKRSTVVALLAPLAFAGCSDAPEGGSFDADSVVQPYQMFDAAQAATPAPALISPVVDTTDAQKVVHTGGGNFLPMLFYHSFFSPSYGYNFRSVGRSVTSRSSYVTRTVTSRGGFGSTGVAHASGGGA
jgi:hypothetical protein